MMKKYLLQFNPKVIHLEEDKKILEISPSLFESYADLLHTPK